MAAPSELLLFNFAYQFERAADGVLDAAGYLKSYVDGANLTLPESRVETTFVPGAAINQANYPLDPENEAKNVYDAFDAQLRFRIVTVRPLDQPSLIPGVGMLHEEWAAAVLMLFQLRRTPFTTANLPYYHVLTIRPAGSQRDLDPRWMEDFTRVDLFVQFGIRSEAWPV